MAESVSTTDLYESTFYLMGGCELVGIEAAVDRNQRAKRLRHGVSESCWLRSRSRDSRATVPMGRLPPRGG